MRHTLPLAHDPCATLTATLLLAALGTAAFFVNDASLGCLFAAWTFAGVAVAFGIASSTLRWPCSMRAVLGVGLAALLLYGWSVCRSPAPNASLLEAYALLAVPAALLVGAALSATAWRRLQAGLLLLGTLFSASGVVQRYGFGGLALGPFLDTNSFAAAANVLLIMALPVLADQQEKRSLRWLAGVAFTASFLAAICAVSRGGWLSLLVVSLLAVWALRGQTPLRKRAAWALALVVLGAALSLAPRVPAAQRLGHDRSVTSRLAQMASARLVAKDYPDGVGLGLWSRVYPRYRLESDDDSAGFHLHNDYLEIQVETGAAGLLAMALPGMLALALLRRVRQRARAGTANSAALAYCLGFLVVALHAMVNFIFHNMVLSLVAGLLLGRAASLLRDNPAPAPQVRLRGAVAGVFACVVLTGWMGLSYLSHLTLTALLTPYGEVAQRFPGLATVPALTRLAQAHPLEPRPPLALGMLLVAQAMQEVELTRPQRVALFEQAFMHYEQARQRDPVDAGIYYQMALAHYYFKDPVEGDRLLSHSLSLNPTYATGLQLYVRLRLARHDFRGARAVLDNALARSGAVRKTALLPLQKLIDDTEAHEAQPVTFTSDARP